MQHLRSSRLISFRKRKNALIVALALATTAAGAIALVWHYRDRRVAWTDDAYVHGNVVQTTALTGGTIVKIAADDTQLVHQGEPLVWLDPADARLRLERARANLAATVRSVSALYARRDQLNALVAARQVDLAKCRDDYRRRLQLKGDGSISAEAIVHARFATQSAVNMLRAAENQYHSLAVQASGVSPADHPAVRRAAAEFETAYLNLHRTIVVAPATGVVAVRTAEVGERIRAGTTLLAIVPINDLWVDANFKETQLRNMRIGQPVVVTSDLYGPNVTYRGRVAGFVPGTGQTFSLLPPQNATGNWIKVVQRVPVRIDLTRAELEKHPLELGLSVSVRVDERPQKGPLYNQSYTSSPRYQTAVYDGILAASHEAAHKIIAANLQQTQS